MGALASASVSVSLSTCYYCVYSLYLSISHLCLSGHHVVSYWDQRVTATTGQTDPTLYIIQKKSVHMFWRESLTQSYNQHSFVFIYTALDSPLFSFYFLVHIWPDIHLNHSLLASPSQSPHRSLLGRDNDISFRFKQIDTRPYFTLCYTLILERPIRGKIKNEMMNLLDLMKNGLFPILFPSPLTEHGHDIFSPHPHLPRPNGAFQ